MSDLYAEVILPLPLHDAFTYKVPGHLESDIAEGKRVVVQFGQKKLYSALVTALSRKKPENIDVKKIHEVLDEQPVVLSENIKLWRWIAKYYCCTLGDVFKAALPGGLKLESKSKVFAVDDGTEAELTEKEQMLLQQIGSENSTVDELQRKLRNDFSYPVLKSLFKKNCIQIEEKINARYKAKTETFVKLHPEIENKKILNNKLNDLQRAKKQQALLLHFCKKINAFEKDVLLSVSKKELLDGTGFTPAVLKELAKKKLVIQFQKQVSRIEEETENSQVSINLLNKHQEKALTEIQASFEKKQVTLIHGITASGKTEIYIHLIDEILKSGKQALYLVPEIALTTQIVRRLKNVFGKKVGIYHSKLSSQERVEIWDKVLQFQTKPENGYQVILGARSAIFMPFSKLGLVIVDEEHENSFKQFDPAPRYNARDMAVILGLQNNAKVLLGSATPSFETYYNAINGKYGLVNLKKRHTNVELPETLVADVKRAYKRKQMHSVLSPELYELMQGAAEKNEQSILFQNRRGYSPFVECFTCGWIPKCKNCDVSLTYHKYKKRLTCHYCGYSQQMPDSCDNCGSNEIKTRGFGTEKIEDELKPLFPNASLARMDLDTARSKTALEKIIQNLESRKTDILIGTQMVTKGLDFEHVSVVGILNADNLLNFPDFRAHERAFQLILQVSGRAGRKNNRGKVVIQTSQPEHPLLNLIISQDYTSVFKAQMEERKLFRYPPFFRLIKIVVKHKNQQTVDRAAIQLKQFLGRNNKLILLGPEYPLVSRIQLWYQKEIWIKFDKSLHLDNTKDFIIDCVSRTKHLPDNSNCIINIDVDPM
ncbi:replication restart helicase PriA [Maribellus maritimus]|uniref:replication restart helicase PriA n=1 Tax=Maribellus maritimus TaxID=2870838 RepID=UPI001EECE20E|nr:primosomal protein N' [Maribellus maritimus]MCG6186655.1 primosomal protein N' [Maribellus maritimus]